MGQLHAAGLASRQNRLETPDRIIGSVLMKVLQSQGDARRGLIGT
jgi:hypothetical protein